MGEGYDTDFKKTHSGGRLCGSVGAFGPRAGNRIVRSIEWRSQRDWDRSVHVTVIRTNR